jgi:hypothetical protein
LSISLIRACQLCGLNPDHAAIETNETNNNNLRVKIYHAQYSAHFELNPGHFQNHMRKKTNYLLVDLQKCVFLSVNFAKALSAKFAKFIYEISRTLGNINFVFSEIKKSTFASTLVIPQYAA